MATPPAQRRLTFASCERESPLSKLTLKCITESINLRVMHIAFEGEAATIEMTAHGLELLKEAFDAWLNGGEDFGVSPAISPLGLKEMGPLDRQSGELWFWGPHYAGP
jgi:hypothetical protein